MPEAPPKLTYTGVVVLRTPDEQRAGGDLEPIDVESLRLPEGPVPVRIDFNPELAIGEAFVHKRTSAKSRHAKTMRLVADITLVTPLMDQRWPACGVMMSTQRKEGAVEGARLVAIGLVARQNTDTGVPPL